MLEELKVLLGIEAEDKTRDSLLTLILNNTQKRLQTLLGGIEPPESLQYVIVEVATIRFNRIGSEGLTSHSIEGETQSFADNDFDAFSGDIQAFLDSQKESTRGKVKFL